MVTPHAQLMRNYMTKITNESSKDDILKLFNDNFTCKGDVEVLEDGSLNILGMVTKTTASYVFESIVITYDDNLPLLRLMGRKFYFSQGFKIALPVARILMKYSIDTNKRSNLIAAQKDLIDAGYEGNAAW
jgi:hypothetical protein